MQHSGDNPISGQFGAIIGFVGWIITHLMNFTPKPTEFIPALITAGLCTILGWCITKLLNRFSVWVSKKFDKNIKS